MFFVFFWFRSDSYFSLFSLFSFSFPYFPYVFIGKIPFFLQMDYDCDTLRSAKSNRDASQKYYKMMMTVSFLGIFLKRNYKVGKFQKNHFFRKIWKKLMIYFLLFCWKFFKNSENFFENLAEKLSIFSNKMAENFHQHQEKKFEKF